MAQHQPATILGLGLTKPSPGLLMQKLKTYWYFQGHRRNWTQCANHQVLHILLFKTHLRPNLTGMGFFKIYFGNFLNIRLMNLLCWWCKKKCARVSIWIESTFTETKQNNRFLFINLNRWKFEYSSLDYNF